MLRVLCRFWPLVLAVLPLAGGCADALPHAAAPDSALPPTATSFDAARCGTISGRVLWNGSIPSPPPFLYGIPHPDGRVESLLIPNPHAPQVHPETRALAGAVVSLRGVPPGAARPWDLPPVRIELANRDLTVIQGDRRGRIGFVRRGDTVAAEAPGPEFHVLRARGAAFFSVPFPDPGTRATRRIDARGRIDLSSGAGYYWAAATLFADDHPYFTVADADGRFSFTQVPEGPVEVAVWLPNWTVAKQERDPESGLIARQSYGPPLEASQPATVAVGRETTVTLTLP